MSQQGCRFLRSTLQTCLCPRKLTLNTWLPRREAIRAQISRRLSAKPVWCLSVAISKRRMSRERISGTRLNNNWSPRPMSLAIIEIVEKKGPLTDLDLHKELKASFGEVSFRELNKNLMKLELGGVLRVSRLMKNKRQVELAGKF